MRGKHTVLNSVLYTIHLYRKTFKSLKEKKL
jgi:hypothetical protein